MRRSILPWDEQMDDEISHLLRVHVEIDTTAIQMEVDEGDVYLLGSVPEDEMRLAAELLVAETPGVRRVRNYLEVKKQDTIFP